MKWIDTHAHLSSREFEAGLDEILERSRIAGIVRTVVIGTDRADSEKGIQLARKHSSLFATVGLHPNNLNDAHPSDFERVAELATEPEVVALGETGLDRHWKTVPFEKQKEYFLAHLELARTYGKPVVIHCREAEADVLEVLTNFYYRTLTPIAGVIHSFTGNETTARQCLELGLHISFAGMLTFKKNDELRAVAASVPLDRTLVETDSPYLAPEPHRGSTNEPSFVIHTGECLAKIHGIPVEDLASITTMNAQRLFGLPE